MTQELFKNPQLSAVELKKSHVRLLRGASERKIQDRLKNDLKIPS